MQPEESDPGLLVGRHVVEVGMRQGCPFIMFADHATGREVRLYADSSIRVSPDERPLRQDDEGLLTALNRLDMLTVDAAAVVDGHLELRLEDRSVWISGDENELSGHEAWRVRVQVPAQPELPPDEEEVRGRLARLLRDDAKPEGFVYPSDFLRVVAKGFADLEPWEILLGDRLHQRLYGLTKRYPQRLVPFAARTDNDDVACWDLDLPSGRVLIVHDWASPGWERREQFDSFDGWFRQAVDDFLLLGAIEQEGPGGPIPPPAR